MKIIFFDQEVYDSDYILLTKYASGKLNDDDRDLINKVIENIDMEIITYHRDDYNNCDNNYNDYILVKKMRFKARIFLFITA